MTDTAARTAVGALPRPGALVGREAEFDALRELLADDTVPVITITGPVGVGKSRLAAEVTHRALDDADTVVVAVPLTGVTDSGLAADALISALSEAPQYAASPAAALWRRAGGQRAVLVLDDADEVEALAELVVDLRDSYPALTVLATRVRPLRVPGERVVAIKPFPAPDSDGDGPAVALFAARAAAADASFVLDAGSRASVAAICRTLGGLPLAIEVAAARVAAVPPAVMARQLERSTALLHQRDTLGVADRHRSIDAALDWSTSLLSPPAAALMTQLAVFEGEFALAAAQQVTEPRLGEPELLDLVSELVDSHLVDLLVDSGNHELLRLDPLVRRHGKRLLAESGVEDRVRDAHAVYWSTQCTLDPSTASRSWPDVLAALDRRISTGHQDSALQLAAIAAPDLALSPGAEATLLPLVETVLNDGSVSDEALVARTLMWATVHSPADDMSTAAYGAWTARRLRQSIALARSSGDDAALLEALELVVSTLGVTFDLEGAVASAHEGHALASRLGNEAALARFEVYVAMTQSLHGDIAAQARSARSAYERASRVGDSEAIIHSALMLRALPPEERGPIPLIELDELLQRAEGLQQPMMVMHVLAPMAMEALAARDQASALSAIGRMLLIAEGVERTWPVAALAPLILLVPVTMARGSFDDTVRVRESIAELEPLLPQILPSLAPTYLAMVGPLRGLVPPEQYDALAAEVRGLTLGQANRRAQAIVRGYLPASEPPPHERARPSVPAGEHLTPRELDVLERLVAGGTNRDIAETLGMTPKTVMHHTVAIYRKLGVRGRAEAVSWALRSGTVVPRTLSDPRSTN